MSAMPSPQGVDNYHKSKDQTSLQGIVKISQRNHNQHFLRAILIDKGVHLAC